jgi:hypothetical protein
MIQVPWVGRDVSLKDQRRTWMDTGLALSVGLAMVLAFLPGAADAKLLPITADAQLVINFDLRELSPPPPYSSVGFDLQTYSSLNPTGPLFIASYGELDGNDLVDLRAVPDFFWRDGRLQFSNANPVLWAKLIDGVFSIGLYTDGTVVDIKSAGYRGENCCAGEVTPYLEYPFAKAVPEPGTAALALSGLIGIAFVLVSARRPSFKNNSTDRA